MMDVRNGLDRTLDCPVDVEPAVTDLKNIEEKRDDMAEVSHTVNDRLDEVTERYMTGKPLDERLELVVAVPGHGRHQMMLDLVVQVAGEPVVEPA